MTVATTVKNMGSKKQLKIPHKNHTRAKEMAQLVKCLRHKHEDLDSDPGNLHNARHPDVPLNPSGGQMGGQDRQILGRLWVS